MTSPLDAVPAPARRLVGFTVGGVLVYAVLVAAGAALFSPAAVVGSNYRIASTVAAGAAAYYLVYLGGYASLRELLE